MPLKNRKISKDIIFNKLIQYWRVNFASETLYIYIYIFNFVQICLFYKRPMCGHNVQINIYYDNTCNKFILIAKLNNLSSYLVEYIVYNIDKCLFYC